MTERVQKYRALQSSFDLVDKKMVDIVIPANIGKVDLSRCNLVVKCDVSTTSTTAGTAALSPPPEFDTFIRIKTTGNNEGAGQAGIAPRSPAALIKHAELRSARLGVIESLRNVDLLRNSLATYKGNMTDLEQRFQTPSNSSNKEFYNNNGILDAVGQGREPSKQRTKDLVVPLHEIFEYCRNPAYDSDKFGDLMIHCEMRFDALDVVATKVSNTVFTVDAAPAGRGDDPANGIKGDFTKVHGGTNPLGANGVDSAAFKTLDIASVPSNDAANIGRTGAGAPGPTRIGTVYRTTAQYADLRDSPFYVGMECFIKVESQLTAGPNTVQALVEVAGIIRNIQRANAPSAGTGLNAGVMSQASDALDLTIEFVATDVGGPAITALCTITKIQIELRTGASDVAGAVAINAPTLAINDVEAQVVVDPGNKSQSPYTYVSYSSEEDVYNPLANFQRNYDIPPNTRNIFVFFGEAATNRSISVSPNLGSYRLTIDNEDVFGRVVNYNSALHRELLSQTFINSGDRVKSIQERGYFNVASKLGGKAGAVSHQNDVGTVLKAIMCPVPMSPVVQKLGLELNGFNDGTGADEDLTGRHVVYFERLMTK